LVANLSYKPISREYVMPVLRDWNLIIDADKVLWGQGADPAVLRARKPQLVAVAEAAIAEGRRLLDPVVIYRRIAVEGLRHERLLLADDGSLCGPLIAKHLSNASQVVTAICTVGQKLTDYAATMFRADPVRGLALDGLASAATEALGEAACQHFEAVATAEGLAASMPLNPGMIGWPLHEGQCQIFSLVSGDEIGVQLTPSGLMAPVKSLSFVIGFGRELDRTGRSCDYCTMRATCRYKDHYV
jgi:hypothetical protein